jgi:DNA (cytosine-5)-methyltransferase 1
MTHGSLFSGIGGWSIASDAMEWETVFNCELNPFGQRVLKYYWPNAELYEDITKTDFSKWRGRIDILSNSFPCQGFSVAGQQRGTSDERYLWPESLRAIKEIQPTWVISENVHGIINSERGMVFEQVQTDLEAAGYEVFTYVLPACGVNAPHRRERIWFIAYRKNIRQSFAKETGREREKYKSDDRDSIRSSSDEFSRSRITTDPGLQRQEIRQEQTAGIKQCDEGVNSNTCNQGLQRGENGREFKSIRKGEKQQLTGLLQPTWEMFPTQSPLCSRDDGFSSELDGITFPKWRNESIKAYGNAIVPIVALQIFKAIEEYELLLSEKIV